jgi:hypothetical protein
MMHLEMRVYFFRPFSAAFNAASTSNGVIGLGA